MNRKHVHTCVECGCRWNCFEGECGLADKAVCFQCQEDIDNPVRPLDPDAEAEKDRV